VDEIPDVLAEAWRRAATAPQGPVYVEVPYDVLQAPAGDQPVGRLDADPGPRAVPPAADLDRAAALLAAAERPLVVAGGGAVRSGASAEVLELAARLDSPVATTYTGKGAFPERHALALGSAWDDAAFREVVTGADVVLVVGSWLGYDVTDGFRLSLDGTLIQIDAAPERIGINLPALALPGDAKATLEALLDRTTGAGGSRDGAERAARVRASVEQGLSAQPHPLALDVLAIVDEALPKGAAAAWDSTILAYTACWYLRTDEPRRFLYPAGSSTLGYAWPAALGAAAALPDHPVLAIAGDGGVQYGLAELATAKQNELDAAVLVIDDGGYGILREYQADSGFDHIGVDLEHPDFLALAGAYDIPARRSSAGELASDLKWALSTRGPALVLLEEILAMPQPTAS
jgi:acetolactate synthase-1/2/3 large subunit